MTNAWFNFSGPRPPVGSGCHRYYAMLYLQTPARTPTLFINFSDPSNRLLWDFPSWASNNSLTKLGVSFWTTQAEADRAANGPCSPEQAPEDGISPTALAAAVSVPVVAVAALGVVLLWRRRLARAREDNGGFQPLPALA